MLTLLHFIGGSFTLEMHNTGKPGLVNRIHTDSQHASLLDRVFGNLSSCEVRDFGSRVNLNKSNCSPFNFSQESWTHLLSVLFIPV